MSTQKQKFALFTRLQVLGFTYEEAAALRRIEMTLQRWAEMECGTDRGHYFKDEATGKWFHQLPGYQAGLGRIGWIEPKPYPIADREAGALRRLKAIVDARNARLKLSDTADDFLHFYHQGDCRGCMLYLVKRSDIPRDYFDRVAVDGGFSIVRKGEPISSAYSIRLKSIEAAREFAEHETLSAFYNRGLAVCA